ncbi:Mpv17/PMP22 family protein [Candidatus Woesearchaeota archaeon]|nr:Mpv17/PMP22 family protein [Candidatus Woesearchaeota archaeon]
MDLDTLVGEAIRYYSAFNQSYPVSASMLTASAIFPTADIASQLITTKKVNWQKAGYTACLAPLYGIAAYFSMRSADLVPTENMPSSLQPLAKAALGPNLWGNLFNAFFFVNNSVGEKSGYRFRELCNHYYSIISPNSSSENYNQSRSSFLERLKEEIIDYIPRREYLKATIGTFTFWNAFQYANYSYVPLELQTPSTLAMALGWTVLLSAWSMLGSRKINQGVDSTPAL